MNALDPGWPTAPAPKRAWPRPLAAVGRADADLVAPGSARTLVAVRSLLALTVGLRLLLRWWSQAAAIPPALWDPVFFVSWLPAPPSRTVLWTLQAAGLVAVALVVARVRARAAFVVAWLCLATLCAVWSSTGKVMHNDVLLLSAAFPLLFAPAPRREDDATVDERWGWAPRAALAVVGLVYFAAGIQKLRYSGIGWVTSENMRWVLYTAPRSQIPAVGRALADAIWPTHLLAGGALLLEVLAPVLLWWRRTRPVFPLLALALHGSIWLLLGLDYYGWWLTTMAVTWPLSPAATAHAAPRWATVRTPALLRSALGV